MKRRPANQNRLGPAGRCREKEKRRRRKSSGVSALHRRGFVGFGVWERRRRGRERLLMAKAFDPDKSWKAELINKMFTLSTLARRSCARGPSLRRLCQRVYVDALLRCLSVHQANWMLSGFAEWNVLWPETNILSKADTAEEVTGWRERDSGLVLSMWSFQPGFVHVHHQSVVWMHLLRHFLQLSTLQINTEDYKIYVIRQRKTCWITAYFLSKVAVSI